LRFARVEAPASVTAGSARLGAVPGLNGGTVANGTDLVLERRLGFLRMTTKFKIGDHVRWNSEAGYASGTIVKVHTRDVDYKGYTHHARVDDPQYEILSDKSDHVAMHKGAALQRIA
jgi:hypothetical protein